jgi:DNA recombination-dependent growth factor C
MFKNLQIYRLPGFLTSAESLCRMLATHEFTPAASNELLRQGWEPPRPAGDLVHVVNGQFLLKLTTDSKVLPAAVINQATKARAVELEQAQGFAPGKKALKELRERVAEELLPRALSVRNSIMVWIDPVNGWLVVDAASATKADEVLKLLLKCVDKFPVESLRVQRSPVGVMTEWLQSDQAPAGFTVDMDATLQATGESKAQVQWKRHSLDAAELGRHIAAGKQCIRLAMTWDSKISFVMTDNLTVKSVKPLDVLTEHDRGADRNNEERLDGDFMLMTGELAKLLADLVEALGGAAEGDAPVTRPAAISQKKFERAVGLSAELYKVRARYRDVLNELYEQTVAPYIERVREQMAATGESAIKCAIDMAHARPAGAQADQMLLVAAVEILEPTVGPAAGDEPVRQQRVVTKLGDAQPDGDGSASDPLYDVAVTVVRTNQRASISLVQRHLRIGYNRAARLLEAMENTVVGPLVSGNREVLKGVAE